VTVQPIAALKATIPTRQKAFMFLIDTEGGNKSRRQVEATEKPVRDCERVRLICESRMKLAGVLFSSGQMR
jgi:hypothetical protein